MAAHFRPLLPTSPLTAALHPLLQTTSCFLLLPCLSKHHCCPLNSSSKNCLCDNPAPCSKHENTLANQPPSPDNRFHPYHRSSGNQQGKQPANQFFPSGAGQTGSSACALCLGRFHHNIHKCTTELLWDGQTKARCSRNAAGHLVNPQGRELCYDWQRPNSCSNTSCSHMHKCSGCGSKDHGAQGCTLSEML